MAVPALLLLIFLLTAAQETGDVAESAVHVAEHEELGEYLTDAEGMSLYLFTNDSKYTSDCYAQCAENWPPLLTEEEPKAGEGVDAELLGTTEREGGDLQVTYNGWPLYYFVNDENPGDTSGQGVGELWYLVSVEGEAVQSEVVQESVEDSTASDEDEVTLAQDGGVYTEEQAELGSRQYRANCAACHGANLEGASAPALSGNHLSGSWSTAYDLYSYYHVAMPPTNPGGLGEEVYVDILAYILKFNGFPAGTQELNADPELLNQIEF